MTALQAAAGTGKLDNVEVLIAAGAKVTARTTNGWTALHSAVQRGDLPMVKKLIAAGADVSRDRKELLDYARSAKSPEIQKAIREAPATPKK
jgi:ankyrin repeat protein